MASFWNTKSNILKRIRTPVIPSSNPSRQELQQMA
ncbi:hypothetical protein E2320_002439 [Naja naja]|nr:hypothetical protein E2320_002439 [Naja naja]